MEFLGKDKLAALEEEKQQRRKARAEEAQKRLAEIGKQTQQMVADHVSPGGAAQNDQDAKTQRIGALSRVLFEQATDVDGRRGNRRNRGVLQSALGVQNTGRDALRTIDDAMRHINNVAQDVTGAGLSGGLENAARSVTDAVNRVSAAVNIGRGGRVDAAHNNPLAELMQRDAEETAAERKQDSEHDRENQRDPHALAHELGGLGNVGGELKARAFAGLELEEPGGARNLIGHELSHVVQQRAGRLVDFGRDIAEAPGRAIENAKATAEDFGDRAANAPRELLQVAQNVPREAIDRATAVPREMLGRAANAPREIAESLRDAPDHVVDNVHQIAHHVEHDHRGLLGELREVGEAAGNVALRGPNEALRDIVSDAPQAARNVVRDVRDVAQNLDPKNAIESVREHVDPRRLADAAADAISPRALVEGAVGAANAAGLTDVPRHLDPRAIAEQALGGVDPRALVRGAVDPMGVLDHAAGAVDKATGVLGAAAGAIGDAAKSLVAPSAPQTAPTATPPKAAAPAGAAPATHAEGKQPEAKHADPKHADPKHAEAHHAANAHAAAHGGADHAHPNNSAHAAHSPAHGSVAHPAAPHTATAHPHPANPSGHTPPQATPKPAPHGKPTNHTPAAARQPAAPHTPASKSKASVDTNAAGETQIALQPVASAATAPTDRKQQIVQPSFQIQGKGENPAPPPLDPAPQAPKINASTPSQAAPAAQVTAPTTAQRAVPPLAPAAASAKPATNPAIAGARAAAAGVKVPQGSISPLPASNTSVAPGAAPSAPGAAAAGPAAVKTAANAPTAPAAAPAPAAAMPAAPAPAAPATNSPAPAAPTVAAVKTGGGGDSVPDPASLVQSTVSLSPDRSATAAAITSEAQTQSKVAPEAASARASQINPLAPQMATTGHSADAPMASASSSAQAEGASAGAQAKANEGSKEAQGKQQISSQMTGAQAERSQFAAMPPPPILQQTGAGAMAPVTQAAQTAVQAAASAVSASAANLDPAVVARGHAAGAVSSTLPAFDAGRFAAIDQRAPLPPTNTASVDAANAVAAGTYAQTNAQIQTLANIPAPVVNAPSSSGGGTKTAGGYPTREAAIADVEKQVTAQSNAQGPGQMKAAAAPVQAQLTDHVTTNQQAAQTQQTTAVAQAQAQAQAIAQQQPPITGAQAAANAKPQYDAHQAAATQAHTQLQQSITQAQQTAQTGVTTAKGQRNQQISTAQSGYTQDVQGQVMPQYATAQAAANQGFQQQSSTAQATLGTDQQTAQTQAASESDAAKAKADADIASHQSALTAQQQQAAASHQQQAAAATAQHNAQMQQQQAQMDAQVQQHQSEMHSQVSSKQAEGQAQINSHLNEGEQGYQSQIQQGTTQANAEKARADAEAAAKKKEADDEKSKHSGGILGGIVGWVKDRIDDLMNAVKSVIEAAKNMVVSIMEKARQAAMAVLEKARQAALAVMNTVKGAIQGIISACASAIRSIINAVAAAIKGLIQALASALKALVAELTSVLHALVSAFQAAMNAALDMLISAVSLVNKNLGDKLRSATQKYRDAFNNAMNGLKANIDKAGQALEHGIQSAADRAMSVVDAAQKTLDDAVTRVEQTLNNAVEAAYNLGVRAVNAAFDAAEAVVNTAFDIAEAGVKAFFDAAIAEINVVQQGIDAVADFVAEVADKVMEACDKLAQAVVSLIPDSFKKAFVDFWNGPWRSIIIIGLATVVAVALTVATGGVAGVLLAGLIGGAITGGAYFGGEMVARESEISLSQEGKGMYIPGYGDVQIGPDGKPIPPAGMDPSKMEDFQKQAGWAASNFNMTKDENGNVTGYDRKSSTDISNAALAEGAKGFVEGAISSSMAVFGGAAGSLVSKGLGLAETTVAGSLVSAGVSNVITGPIQNSLTTGFDAAFEAIKEGKSPGEAFMSGLKAGGDAIKDPTQWATAFLTMGIAPAKMKFLEPFLKSSAAKQGENAVAKALIEKGGNAVASTVENTLTSVGGQFAGTYAKALSEGKTPAQALEEARKAADAAFTPEGIATTALMSAAGSISHKSQAEVGEHEGHTNPAEGEHGPTTEHGPSEDHTTPSSQRETSTTPERETTSRTPQEETAAAANTGSGNTEDHPTHTTERTTSRETTETPQGTSHEVERSTQTERQTASSTERTTAEDQKVVTTERDGLDERIQLNEPPREDANPNDKPSLAAEHEQRLDQIEKMPETDASPETKSAVREARSEIARLANEKTQAENGTGLYEHLTEEQRAAKVADLQEQIDQKAAKAVEDFDKATTREETDEKTLKELEERSPEERDARVEAVKTAREKIAARDQALVEEVAKKTITLAGVQHVEQVFEHVTLGSGFAGTANEMSRPNATEGDIVIGGKNPWDGAAAKLGQQAGQSELPNAKAGNKMTETNSDPTHRYMLASEHADNVAINKADQGIRTYDGKSGAIEPGPRSDWPAFAREGGAKSRMLVEGPNGPTYFYSKETDVAVGPGPSRKLDENVLSEDTIKRMKAAGAFANGDQGFAGNSVREGEILNYGAGASGAWGSEATASVKNGEGAHVNDVEWMGAFERAPAAKKAELKALLESAKTPEEVAAAHQKINDFMFTEAKGNGFLPRNRVEGAAFDPEMQKSNGGNISRSIVEKIEKITFEPQPGNEAAGDRVKIVVTDVNGEPRVIWKDAMVLSIGQDAKGAGGPVSLLEHYNGELKPIYGKVDEVTGIAPVVGMQSLDGSVRVLGAAATPADVSAMMASETKGGLSVGDHQDNLLTQAKQLHEDSNGVVGGFVLAQKHIEAANETRARELENRSKLGAEAEQTAEEQKRRFPIAQVDKPLEAIPVSKMSSEVRSAAREKWSSQIEGLESNGQIPMPSGKASVEMMAGITAATGKEVALLRLPNGERVLRIGNESSVELERGTKIIAHTHPEGNLQFSSADESALRGVKQSSSVLIGADGTAGRFKVSDKKITPAHISDESPTLHQPDEKPAVEEKAVDLKDPDRFAKYAKDADSLHKNISESQRLQVVSDFPVKEITSAPGHQNLRKPEAMLGMSKSMTEKGTGAIFDGAEKIKLNIFTEEVNGHVRIKSIEVQDGNHRLAAGLHAEKWNSIKDIPAEYLSVEVNGFDTNGVQHDRWIPLEVAKESTIPKDQWFEVPADWGAKGPTAQVHGSVSSQDATIPEHFRGVPLDRVIARSLERTGGAPEGAPAEKISLHEPPRTPEQERRVTPDEVKSALRPPTGDELVAKALRPDISGPLANDEGKAMGAKLGPVPEGMIRLVDGTLAPSSSHGMTPEARAMLAGSAPQTGPRKVVVDGGGPTGALAAIQAFHAGHEVTVVEMRDAATLPVLWSNRPGSADILASIDPVLAERVGAQSNRIKFYEHVDADGHRSASHAQEHTADAAHATGDPRAIAGEASSWQSQNKTEVTLMWDRLVELEAKEKVDAAAEGREPRIKLMRGYQVTELPAGEGGNKRSVVVQKMEQRLTQVGSDGKPVMNAEGKPTTMPYNDGDPVPAGFKIERVADGKNVNLGTPDDMFVAEGAGSKTRGLAGAQSLEVGPSAQYIAGYFHGETVKGTDAAGNRVQGGSRSIEERGKNGDIIHAVAGSGEHLDGTWALPEVDPALNLKDPASIKAYFGREMSTKEATSTYYKQQIAKVLEIPPERIPDNFEMGPAAFTMQSHVSSRVADDASNVHLIGDSRGNSHFLASLGKVTGTGTHQMAIKQYFQALEWGMNPKVAHELLERRLDAGTRAWLKSGLPSMTGFKYPEIEGKPGGMPTDMPLGGLGAGGRVPGEAVTATSVEDMSPGDRSAAREKYATQIKALDQDGVLAVPRGQVDKEMMAGITAATGHEVALLRLETGERVLKIGDDHTVDLPQGAKIIAHTHPGGNLQFSNEDIAAFHAAGQKSSVLIGADGTSVRLRVGEATSESQQHDGLSLHEDVPTPEQEAAAKATPAETRETAAAAKEAASKKEELTSVLTAGGYTDAATQKQTVEQYTEYFAQQLLIAKGIETPTQSQITETAFKLGEALKNDTWKDFKAPIEKSAIAVQDNVNQRLGNTFGEKKVFTAEELKYENLKMGPAEQQRLADAFPSGAAGMVDAASFINTPSRSEGDFSHAYGKQAWDGFVQAKSYLDEIPKGQFLDKLDVETMMKVNQLSFAEDTGLKAKVLRLVAYVGRGFEWDNGGNLRGGQQYARPEKYSKAEIENLREAGVTVNQINTDKEGGGYAQLHYPPPEQIKPTLEKLVGDLKASLAKPGADPIAAASEFQRHFVALHPFGDSNGRTSRILMNRILAEYDLSPAILSDQNRDISLSPAEWRDEVAKGTARSKKYIAENQVQSKDDYAGTEQVGGIPADEIAMVQENKKVSFGGKPFALGHDGLMYDSTGRPYIVENNELVPLAQLEHYMIARRVSQMGPVEGSTRLQQVNDETRALYKKVLADPTAAKDIKVHPDDAARAADEKYKLNPDPAVAKMLTELSDITKADPATLFTVNSAKGSATSSIVSKHTQMDLELWYLEKGLKDSKQPEYAEQVRAHRAKLFEIARAALLKSTDPTRVSPENPMGFRFQYEKMMYDTSPLRFKDLAEAIAASGDSKLTFWRGDYSFARVAGMAPNNDVRQPDAKHIADERASKSQITNLYDDLTHLEGTAVGSQYISTTSDLSLLGDPNGFAAISNSQNVSVAKLPKMAKDLLLGWLAPHFPEGTTEEQKATAIKEAAARGGSVIPTAGGGKEIRNAFGIPGSIITVDIVDKATGQLKVTAPRKVFKLIMDKDAVLPGIQTLGHGVFNFEQELHGLERVYPWNIKEATEAGKLTTEFPVTTPATPAAPTPATPTAGPDGTVGN